MGRVDMALWHLNCPMGMSLALCLPFIDKELDVAPVSRYMLEITTLYNGMILSTLSLSSCGFALGFHKGSRTNGDVFFYL